MGRPIRRGAMLALVALLGLCTAAMAEVIQTRDLRITLLSQIMPYKLPRQGLAPIAVFVAGHLESPRGGVPPQLQKLRIEMNRHGVLQSRGLPVCGIQQIESVSTEQALSNCGTALIGSGRFWADIIFSGQSPYPTRGRLLIFNGRRRGKPALLAHIFNATPFNSSFVIPFAIRRVSEGNYGTVLTASLPEALGSWGYLNRIKLTLKRKYVYGGRRLSYFNASCPAPNGDPVTLFPLARASFFFANRRPIMGTVTKSCGVKE